MMFPRIVSVLLPERWTETFIAERLLYTIAPEPLNTNGWMNTDLFDVEINY